LCKELFIKATEGVREFTAVSCVADSKLTKGFFFSFFVSDKVGVNVSFLCLVQNVLFYFTMFCNLDDFI